ncbi:IS21-like element helper ATPase IstB [Alkaliphilus transvaalensis]|nr:IS21-like element helper ATPase IstB [Alkaliphilus transvaalensis]
MNKQDINDIRKYIQELKLPGVSNILKEKLEQAYQTDMSYEGFLKDLLEAVVDTRKENGKKNRIRNAKFPYKKYLEDLLVDCLPEDAKKRLKELKTLKFIEEGRNVILAGNPGTGKTHISIGLGIHACNAGYKVLFATVPLLINEMKECRANRSLRAFEKKFEKYDLIIADELGYISFDKEGSELLFTHLSLRAERKSTVITSNLAFNRWNEIFNDPVLTAAMVDRLTHRAHVVNMNGDSYRTKETLEMLQ